MQILILLGILTNSMALPSAEADVSSASVDSILPDPQQPSVKIISLTLRDSSLWNGKSNHLTLKDDDGMASLYILDFMATQSVADKLHQNAEWSKTTSDWSAMKAQLVPDSPALLKAMNLTLGKLTASLKGSTLTDELSAAQGLTKMLAGKSQLTYDDLNSVGSFLDQYAVNHSYEVSGMSQKLSPDQLNLLDNNTRTNPLGTLLTSRQMKLPSEIWSTWMGTFDLNGNLKELANQYSAVPSAEGKSFNEVKGVTGKAQ